MDKDLKQVLDWNESNPPGTRVRVTNLDGSTFETYTLSNAKLLGMDVIVIWVDCEDFGCRLLKVVEAIK